MRRKGFPTFAVIVLVLSLLYLLDSLNILATRIPWLPIILIIVASGWIVDRYSD